MISRPALPSKPIFHQFALKLRVSSQSTYFYYKNLSPSWKYFYVEIWNPIQENISKKHYLQMIWNPLLFFCILQNIHFVLKLYCFLKFRKLIVDLPLWSQIPLDFYLLFQGRIFWKGGILSVRIVHGRFALRPQGLEWIFDEKCLVDALILIYLSHGARSLLDIRIRLENYFILYLFILI